MDISLHQDHGKNTVTVWACVEDGNDVLKRVISYIQSRTRNMRLNDTGRKVMQMVGLNTDEIMGRATWRRTIYSNADDPR